MNSQFPKARGFLLVLALMAGCKGMTGKTAQENVDDATLTASVTAKLGAEKTSYLTRVDVDTNNRIVYLNGIVDSDEQKSRAEKIASEVEGVNGVVNNLEVQKHGHDVSPELGWQSDLS
jgi:osmotically-inducible protein OsmY